MGAPNRPGFYTRRMPDTTPENSADPKAADARALGVCSWSLRPSSPADLVAALKQIPADGEPIAVQLALDPIRRGEWDEHETFDRLADAGIAVFLLHHSEAILVDGSVGLLFRL